MAVNESSMFHVCNSYLQHSSSFCFCFWTSLSDFLHLVTTYITMIVLFAPISGTLIYVLL